ncbi:MAG: presenilin family intramembrane aspartyl protease [Candidatus Paceibacterota bacterium]|jgi:presenilin-like A22 family membrane protease
MSALPTITIICIEQLAIVCFFAISGYIAFSGIADKVAEGKLASEAKTKSDVARQSCKLVIRFIFFLSVAYLLIFIGASLRVLVLIIFLLSTEELSHDLISHFNTGKIVSRIISVTTSATINLGWFVYPNWITIDLAETCVAMHFFVAYRNIKLKQCAVITLGIMTYDALMVFGTGLMQKVAGGLTVGGKAVIPALIMIPKSLSLDGKTLFCMGLGDIVLPGFIVVYAMRQALKHKAPSLAIGACLGYVAGSVIALSLFFVFKSPQPATIYLMPGVFVGFFSAAWYKGLLNEVLCD